MPDSVRSDIPSAGTRSAGTRSADIGTQGARPHGAGPIRYGVVGTGMMGVEHIANIAALRANAPVTITAVADPDDTSRAAGVAAAAEAGEQVQAFSDHRELLDSGLCDAVVIVSPNYTHIDVAGDALATDLHVMIEKPLATTVADAARLVELDRARAGRAITWVALEYRYMPPAAELIRLVHAGTVGTPRMVAMREHRFPFLHKVGEWNRLTANTGGTLVEKTCHFFDLMNLVLGERPTRVMASGAQDVNHLDEVVDGRPADMLDNAFVIVDYPSGARALLDLCMFAEATENQEELSVVGDRGKVEALIPAGTVRIGRRGEHFIGNVESYPVHDDSIAHDGLHHGSSYIEHVRFAAAIRTGSAPEVTTTDGLWSVAAGVAAHRSIELGRPVALAEVMEGIAR